MGEDRLWEARNTIREVDREMATLFSRRMEAVREVTAYKRERGIPIMDEAQERAVVQRNLAYVEDEDLHGLYARFIRDVMDLSKQYQRRLMSGMRVAYSGIEGAFAHIASRRIFPGSEAVACPDFRSAYEAVEKGECDVCVLPLENSFAGEVGQVTDLMFSGTLHVNAVYDLPVTHCLLGLPGAKLSDLKRVVSHPQALSQCAGFIGRHGLEPVQAENTARAAYMVTQEKDPATAAIASAETAELYGLTILERAINESSMNSTRFAVFSCAENRRALVHADGFLILFTVNHMAGALAAAVSVIGAHGFSMRVLRSRPMRDLPWHYYFFAEIEGDDRTDEGRKMLEELATHCNVLKVAGRFGPETVLERPADS